MLESEPPGPPQRYDIVVADSSAGNTSTKVLIVFVVFPISLVAFSRVAQPPLWYAATLVAGDSRAAHLAAGIVGFLLGGAGALWTCRFAWPRSKRPDTSAS